MLRFKQFVGAGPDIESAVNAWLTEFEPDVTQMAQMIAADGSIIMSFLFEESFRGQELRLSEESGISAPSPAPARGMASDTLRVTDEPGIEPPDLGSGTR